MWCCVCRWELLALGGNTEVRPCCKGATLWPGSRMESVRRGRKGAAVVLAVLMTSAGLSETELVEPQGQTGEKLL